MNDAERHQWVAAIAGIWLVSVLMAFRAAGFDLCVWAWMKGVM